MEKNREDSDWSKIRNILTVAGEKSKLTYIIDECVTTNKNMSTLDLAEKIALTILKSGYTYLECHKIKDNDFPEDGREVLAYYADEEKSSGYGCDIAWYNSSTKEFNSNTISYPYITKIVAWIDKPKYFEFDNKELKYDR